MNIECKCDRVEGAYIFCDKHFKEAGAPWDKKINELKFKCNEKRNESINFHLSNVYLYLSTKEGEYVYSKSMVINSFNIIKKYAEGCLKKEKTEIPLCKRCHEKFSDYREPYPDYRGNGYFHLCPLDIPDKYKAK